MDLNITHVPDILYTHTCVDKIMELIYYSDYNVITLYFNSTYIPTIDLLDKNYNFGLKMKLFA